MVVFLQLKALLQVGTHGTVVEKNITGHAPRCPLERQSSGVETAVVAVRLRCGWHYTHL